MIQAQVAQAPAGGRSLDVEEAGQVLLVGVIDRFLEAAVDAVVGVIDPLAGSFAIGTGALADGGPGGEQFGFGDFDFGVLAALGVDGQGGHDQVSDEETVGTGGFFDFKVDVGAQGGSGGGIHRLGGVKG